MKGWRQTSAGFQHGRSCRTTLHTFWGNLSVSHYEIETEGWRKILFKMMKKTSEGGWVWYHWDDRRLKNSRPFAAGVQMLESTRKVKAGLFDLFG